jgi:hypothetical protein
MNNDTTQITDSCDATIGRHTGHKEQSSLQGRYEVVCRNAAGEVLWEDVIDNLVTTHGKNLSLDVTLGTSATSGAIVMGLKGVGTADVADTQASHATWLEVGLANLPTYTAPRKTPTFSAAAAGVKATSAAAVFTFTGSGTIAGCFLNMGGSATIDDTTGTLFSAGDFTAGNKTVTASDTLSVSWSLTAT